MFAGNRSSWNELPCIPVVTMPLSPQKMVWSIESRLGYNHIDIKSMRINTKCARGLIISEQYFSMVLNVDINCDHK